MIYVFTTNNAIGSRFIRWGTRSKVSHMMVVKDVDMLSEVIESRGGKGVHKSLLQDRLKHNKVVRAFVVDLPKKVTDKMWEKTEDLIGEDYDYKGIFFFIAMLAVMDRVLQMGRSRENKWADSNDYICSELILAAKTELKKHTPIAEYSEQMISPDIGVEIFERGNDNILEIDLCAELYIEKEI